MTTTSDISVQLLILFVVYCEKLMAVSTAQQPVAELLHQWAQLELKDQASCLDKQFMKIHSAATGVSVNLSNVVLDMHRVICRLLMRILCTGEWNIDKV